MYPLPSHRRQELSTAAYQPSPVGATMHAIQQSTPEDICSAKKHASCHHITRSVSGMKSLLPLRLLSPTLPDINVWPSSTPNNRSTFGMDITSNDEDHNGISREQLNDEQDADIRVGSQRLKPYRDVPIYSEPGSPLLNRAYLTDEEVHSSCSTSESEEWFEVYDCLSMDHESICGDEASTIKVSSTALIESLKSDSTGAYRRGVGPCPTKCSRSHKTLHVAHQPNFSNVIPVLWRSL